MRKNTRTLPWQSDIVLIGGAFIHINLNAVPKAAAVSARLIHGPHSITPAITTMAKRGKNDLPKTSRVSEIILVDNRPILSSFPLKFSCALDWVRIAAKNDQCLGGTGTDAWIV